MFSLGKKLLRFGASFLFFCSLLSPIAKAVIFYSTSDPAFNTTAPSGPLAGSGWQWVGFWGSFQGTVIDAHHFLTANHVGGSIGDTFTYQGFNYTTVNSFTDSASDLRIWEVRESFPSWAPLYRTSDEVGRILIVFGRGITRGAEMRTTVEVEGVPADSLAGWHWGPFDGKLRWGLNRIAGTVKRNSFGEQLGAVFPPAKDSNLCHLGVNDSGAPVFVNDGTSWKLAGIAGLVDGGFSTTEAGARTNAFVFDARGLFVNGKLKTGPRPIPSSFYATRISVRLNWINGILSAPLTATVTLSNLNQIYDGIPHPVTVSTNPAGLTYSITYNGAATAPVNAGTYAIVTTVTSSGYAGSATGTLTISKTPQTTNSSTPPARP